MRRPLGRTLSYHVKWGASRADRALAAARWVDGELRKLVAEIGRLAAGEPKTVPFGTLFRASAALFEVRPLSYPGRPLAPCTGVAGPSHPPPPFCAVAVRHAQDGQAARPGGVRRRVPHAPRTRRRGRHAAQHGGARRDARHVHRRAGAWVEKAGSYKARPDPILAGRRSGNARCARPPTRCLIFEQ